MARSRCRAAAQCRTTARRVGGDGRGGVHTSGTCNSLGHEAAGSLQVQRHTPSCCCSHPSSRCTTSPPAALLNHCMAWTSVRLRRWPKAATTSFGPLLSAVAAAATAPHCPARPAAARLHYLQPTTRTNSSRGRCACGDDASISIDSALHCTALLCPACCCTALRCSLPFRDLHFILRKEQVTLH